MATPPPTAEEPAVLVLPPVPELVVVPPLVVVVLEVPPAPLKPSPLPSSFRLPLSPEPHAYAATISPSATLIFFISSQLIHSTYRY